MTSVLTRDDVMSDALTAMNDLAVQVRESHLEELHRDVRRWVYNQPEHAVVMLIAAACLIDPDESLKYRQMRLARILSERAAAGVAT